MPDACLRPDLTLPTRMTPFIEGDLSPLPVSAKALTSCGLEWKKLGYMEGCKCSKKNSEGTFLTNQNAGMLNTYSRKIWKYKRKQPPEKEWAALLRRQCQQSGCGLDIAD